MRRMGVGEAGGGGGKVGCGGEEGEEKRGEYEESDRGNGKAGGGGEEGG